MLRIFLAALVLCLSMAPVHAVSASPAAKAPSYVFIGRMTSQSDEDKTAFVFRVAQRLSSYTQETGFEGCGVLMGSGEGSGWRVYLVSRQSHLACTTVSFEDDAFAVAHETIHSHPQTSGFKANLQDGQVYSFAACGSGVRVHARTFSEGDYHSGPGYLVAKSNAPFAKVKLLYQSGKGSEVSMGQVPDGDVALDRLAQGESLPTARVSDGSIALAVSALPTRCPVYR